MGSTPSADTAVRPSGKHPRSPQGAPGGVGSADGRLRIPWWLTGDGWRSYELPRDARMERAGWSAAAVLVLCSAVAAWSSTLLFAGAGALQVAALAMSLVGLARCWACPEAPGRWTQALVLGAGVVALGTSAAGAIIANPFYGTDSVAFGQYQAHLALAGTNPFTASLAPSLARYHVPVNYTTHFLDGSAVTKATYPAGSFLFYMPALALGLHAQAAIIVDLILWVAAIVMMWRLLPGGVGWLAVVFAASTVYTSYIVGGVTDAVYLPFLLLAMWRWDRYGVRGAGLARWVGPVALGLAMSVKQTPWFFAPFLAIGVANEARARGDRWGRIVAGYVAVAGATFLLVNLTWILDDPLQWGKAILVPLTAHFVPLGQGLINVTLANRLGGGNLSYFSDAGLAWVGLVVVLTLWRYRAVKRLWPFLVVACFFFTPRSLGNYFMMMLPAALVGSLTVAAAPDDGVLVRRARQAFLPLVAATAAATAGFTAGALGTPAPLAVRVLGVVTNGQAQLVTTAQVQVTNRSSRELRPDFSAVTGGYLTNFWRTLRGGLTVAVPAHSTRRFELYAPDVSSMPSATNPFQLVAYTERPDSVSSSRSFSARADSVELLPTSVDTVMALHHAITVTAQLDDPLGRALPRAGVPIDLGQITYAERGLLGGTASIDGRPEGQSPVQARTDARGRATFTVRGVQGSTDPTYLQAWIAPHGSVRAPHGYSQMVSLRFAPGA